MIVEITSNNIDDIAVLIKPEIRFATTIPVDNEGFRERMGLRYYDNNNSLIKDVVNSRFNKIMLCIEDLHSPRYIKIYSSFICPERGSTFNHVYYLESLMVLGSQSHDSKIDVDTLDIIGALINMQSFMENKIPNIFVHDFLSYCLDEELLLKYSRERYLDDRLNSRKITNAFRFRCSKITMFPFILHGIFMVAILTPAESKAYVLTCNKVNHIVAIIKEYVSNLISYVEDYKMKQYTWTIYVDGEDANIPGLYREGMASNCGVYCCCYMINIALYPNIDEVLEMFQKKEYYKLFNDINQDTILYKRKLLTVMIVDAEATTLR